MVSCYMNVGVEVMEWKEQKRGLRKDCHSKLRIIEAEKRAQSWRKKATGKCFFMLVAL